MPIVIALVIALVAFLLISRARELFVLRVRGGRVEIVRGSVPGGLVGKFSSALQSHHNGTIRVARTPNGARLTARGLDSATEQRLRNIFGLVAASQLSAPEIDKRRAANDILSLAWLIDLLRRR